MEDVLTGGAVTYAQVAEAVSNGDLDAGVLTDEELALLSPDLGGEADPRYDASRLSQLTEREQDAALASVLWVLRANGVVRRGGGGEPVFVGLPAVIGEARWGSEETVRLRVDFRGEGIRRAAVYRVRSDLFLTEEIAAEEGLHAFAFRSPASQAAWLAAAVDPRGRARETRPAQSAAKVEDLDVTPDQLAAESETSAVAVSKTRGEPARRRSFTAYTGPEGLRVLHGWQLGDGGEVHLQRLGRRHLYAFCTAFLAPDPTRPPMAGAAP